MAPPRHPRSQPVAVWAASGEPAIAAISEARIVLCMRGPQLARRIAPAFHCATASISPREDPLRDHARVRQQVIARARQTVEQPRQVEANQLAVVLHDAAADEYRV